MDDGMTVFRDRMDIKKYFEERGFSVSNEELYDHGAQIGICIYQGDRNSPSLAHCVRCKLPTEIWNEMGQGLAQWLDARSLP